jgi:hypothetical protein
MFSTSGTDIDLVVATSYPTLYSMLYSNMGDYKGWIG